LVANGDFDGYLLFLQVSEDVSIGEPAPLEQLNAFPNPTIGDLNVQVSSVGVVPFRIIDGAGRIVLEGEFTPGMNTVQVGSLAQGNYCIQTARSRTPFILN
jgi:hypothetical protein